MGEGGRKGGRERGREGGRERGMVVGRLMLHRSPWHGMCVCIRSVLYQNIIFERAE